jgi:hypothetical protein
MPDCDRALWVAVIQQAREDIEDLPIGSTDYQSAVAFVTSTSAHWRRGRNEVCEHLGIHGDDLLRAGRRWVAERRRSEGLPDQPPAPARPVKLTVVPPRPVSEPLVIPDSLLAFLPQRRRREDARNPFHPGYKRSA